MARLLGIMFFLVAGCSHGAEPDDLEKLFAIGDEAFEPVTWPLHDPPFVHQKSIQLSAGSLADGWVANRQCHSRFAKMPSLQIVFPEGKIRNIVLTETTDLARAWVDGVSVQLEQVRPESKLCFRSENRLLTAGALPRQYELKVGPFYYRYLDGYFPLLVDLSITYPKSLLRVLRIDPDTAPAVNLVRQPGHIQLKSLFQGTLWVRVVFESITDPLSKPR